MTKKHVNFDNYKEASIDEYFYDFREIWRRDFKERSSFDLWLHVVDHASRVARAIRKQQPPGVIDDIADTTVWLFSFLAHCLESKNQIDAWFNLNQTPSQIIWRKYPGTCPSCFDFNAISFLFKEIENPDQLQFSEYSDLFNNYIEENAQKYINPENCTCLSRQSNFLKEKVIISKNRGFLDNLRRKYSDRLIANGKNISSMSGLQSMFHHIFSNTHHIISLENVAFHLLEEIGEATQSFKDLYTYDDSREPYTDKLEKIRIDNLGDEIADVFSWIFTIVLKLNSTYVYDSLQYLAGINRGIQLDPVASNLSLAGIIWSKYGQTKSGANLTNLICTGCLCSPCECSRDLKIEWASTKIIDKPKVISSNAKKDEIKDLVFISYSHLDESWLVRLKTMLKPMARNSVISFWTDKDIQVGDKWLGELEAALSRAKIAILLVSDNFLASDFIVENELPPLLDSARKTGLSVIWVPVSHCLYDETEISAYQAAWNPKEPLDGLSDSNIKSALTTICKKIREIIKQGKI